MNKYFFIATLFLFFSCGKDSTVTDDELIGTWILESVEGTCLGLPNDGTADDTGCIGIPTLEVNCSIIEINGAGKLSYAYSLNKGEGTYEIMDEGINICTDRCLIYKIEGSKLTLQTGTIELCDPLYTFKKTTTALDEIISEGIDRKITSIRKNGNLYKDYKYASDGSLQSILEYDNNGNLRIQEVYVYTPLTTTRTRTFVQNNITNIYNYFDEAPDRTRRDQVDQNGLLVNYKLYFHTPTECWIDRSEIYEGAQLIQLYQHAYSGENCNEEITYFREGELISKIITTKDGMRYYANSALLDILKVKDFSNTTSYMYLRDNEIDQVSSYNSVFVYSEGGYPSTETRTYLNGNVVLFTYEYK